MCYWKFHTKLSEIKLKKKYSSCKELSVQKLSRIFWCNNCLCNSTWEGYDNYVVRAGAGINKWGTNTDISRNSSSSKTKRCYNLPAFIQHTVLRLDILIVTKAKELERSPSSHLSNSHMNQIFWVTNIPNHIYLLIWSK